MDITTIKYPSHNDLVQWYYQLAQQIVDGAGVTPEEVNVYTPISRTSDTVAWPYLVTS